MADRDESALPRILLVDDDPVSRALMRRFLETEYAVAVVNDGLEALRALAARLPDVVISDVEMPRLDGFKLVQILKTDVRFRQIPILLASGHQEEKVARDCSRIGADGYILKPVRAEQIRAGVLSVLSSTTSELGRNQKDSTGAQAGLLDKSPLASA